MPFIHGAPFMPVDPGPAPPIPGRGTGTGTTEIDPALVNPRIYVGASGRNWVRATKAPASVLDDAQPDPQYNDTSMPSSSDGTILPVPFGRVSLTPTWGVVYTKVGMERGLWLLLVWGKGEVQGFVNVYADQIDITSGDHPFVGLHNYKGTPAGAVDTYLNDVALGMGAAYTDTLPGICYSVAMLDSLDLPSIPQFTAIIDGIKLYDPRTTLTVFSRNPALMYRYVAVANGLSVKDTQIIATANACDELINGKPRRQCGIAFSESQAIDATLQVLAEYAGAYHYIEGNTAYLIPDRPSATAFGFTWNESDSTKAKILDGSFRLKKKSLKTTPNYVVVEYTNTSVFPWRRDFAYPASYPSGIVIPTRINLQAVHDFTTANRARIERQNRYTLSDTEVSFSAFDESLALEVGDVFTIDSPDLTLKRFRAVAKSGASEQGQWDIVGEEYDPAIYSNVEVNEPTYPDTSLPDPSLVPAGPSPDSPLADNLKEVLWTDETGHTFTVFKVRFSGITWRWVKFYRIKVYSATEVIFDHVLPHLGASVLHEIRTSPTKQGVQYTVEIYVININGQTGTPSSNTITGNGKVLVPPDVSPVGMTSIEFGQMVWINHAPSYDTDLTGYRYKRLSKTDYTGAANDNARWNHVNVVTVSVRNDAPSILIPAQPVGTWMYGVKALDSVPTHESVNAAWIEQIVTADNAGSISVSALLNGTASNMHVYANYGVGVKATSARSSDSLVSRFGTQSNPWPVDQTKPFGYGFTFASSIQSVEWDTGVNRTGSWSFLPAALVALNGTAIVNEIMLATTAAYSTFTTYSGSAVQQNARYMKSKVSVASAANAGFTITFNIAVSYQGVLKTETLTVSVPAAGQPYSFSWVSDFTDAPAYSWVVEGTEPVVVAFDSVDSNGGYARAWAATGHSTVTAGQPCAATLKVTAEGA